MAKRKRRSTGVSTKRRPPSIPACLKKVNNEQYVTMPIDFKGERVYFSLNKSADGYTTRKHLYGTTVSIDMRDAKFAPTTRAHFAPQKTLSLAVTNLEIYLNCRLPDYV